MHLVALAGLAIGVALAAVAQEQNAVNQQARQEIEGLILKGDDAYNQNNPAAVAAQFTYDAIEVFGWQSRVDAASGQPAISERYAFQLPSPGELSNKLIQLYAIGNEICAVTEFQHVVLGRKGYSVRIYVREGDNWKIRMAYAN